MLDRKLLRDLSEIGMQVIAIALVMAAGVAMFIMATSSLYSLSSSMHDYYRRYRFAEVFASAKRVPNAMVARIEQIPGIAKLDTRIVSVVTLDLPDMPEPAAGLFISIPDFSRPALNDLYLVRGRMPDADRGREIVVSKSFAEAHKLVPGSPLRAIINGKRQDLEIVGIVLTPEYVIQIPPGSLLPDHKRYGIMWMSRRQMEAAFDMAGAFNDLSALLERDTNETAVLAQLDTLLEPFGCTGSYGRDKQTSHMYISDEIRQLSTMALVAPTIFLGVAAFLLNVVIARIVGLQREQIAALKAFGYTNLSVGTHYLKLVLVIAMLGCLLGTVFGFLLARSMTQMYAQFYQFPHFSVEMHPGIVMAALSVSFVASTLGAWNAVRRAVSLPPAEAMRPEPPPIYQATWFERLGVQAFLPQVARMVLRQIERKSLKSTTAILGIGMSVAILMLGSFSLDAVNYIMHFQFCLAQRQHVSVALTEPAARESVFNFNHLPGVIRTQPFRGVATKISSDHRWRRVGILGLDHNGGMFRLLDVHERPTPFPEYGIILNDKLAELLHVRVGEFVTVSVLEGKRPTVDVIVSQIVTEFGGLNAYMSRAALHRILGESETVSGAFLAVDEKQIDTLFQALKETPHVANVTIKDAAYQSFRNTIAENILMMRTFNVLFSIIIAVGVVYNSARISLSEQSRELATLRVMGFSHREVSAILLGELALLTFIAIPVGWIIGYGLVATFVMGLDTEVYRIPLVIDRTTYVFAGLVVIVAAFVSGIAVQRRIRKLDLIGVLKTRE